MTIKLKAKSTPVSLLNWAKYAYSFACGLFSAGSFVAGLIDFGLFTGGLFVDGLFVNGLFSAGLFAGGLFLLDAPGTGAKHLYTHK